MRTRLFLRRGVLPISCLALLLVWTRTGQPQPQTAPGQVPPPPQLDLPPVAPAATPDPTRVPGDASPLPTQPAPMVMPPAAPPQPTVEDLIRNLEQLRKQKADLEKAEQAVVLKLKERLKDQRDRLTNLGVLPVFVADRSQPEPQAPWDGVGVPPPPRK